MFVLCIAQIGPILVLLAATAWGYQNLEKDSYLQYSYQVLIPQEYNVGHEAHFAQVTESFLSYLAAGRLPGWEVPNMLTKYRITTEALTLARGGP